MLQICVRNAFASINHAFALRSHAKMIARANLVTVIEMVSHHSNILVTGLESL